MCPDAVFISPARLRRFALWAGLAFALSVFSQFALMTPGGARAGDNDAFIEVCTAAGMLRILSTSATDDAPPSSSGGFHCPLCIITADDAAVPAAPPVLPLPESVSARHLRLHVDAAPGNPPNLRHAPPRAPPFAFA
ncbi:MAG: DUF2946 family protein [Zoogloeaceae bacterium]|nr:DUF2946 family protein [Zoogloeaceae bacterium]